jgi:hypothetical protein
VEISHQEPVAETRHRGPNLGALSVVYTVLFLASLVVTAVMTNGEHFPSPFVSVDVAQAFFARNANAVRLAAFLQFGAAIPLGIFAATAASRLQFLGVNAAGVFIALFGGIAASLFAAASALFQWVLAQPGVASHVETTRVLHLLSFATGGVAYTVLFGLLVAGVSVIAWFTKLLPPWLVWVGLVIAAVAELTSLSLVFTPLGYLLPAVRFPGFIWMIAAGYLLPRSRVEARRRIARPSAA